MRSTEAAPSLYLVYDRNGPIPHCLWSTREVRKKQALASLVVEQLAVSSLIHEAGQKCALSIEELGDQ